MDTISKQGLWQGTEEQDIPFPAPAPLSSCVTGASSKHVSEEPVLRI